MFSGEEARRVFDDAQKLLDKLIDNQELRGRGLVGFWPAQSVGDDIHVFAENSCPHNSEPVAIFHGLRQQVCVISTKLLSAK